MSDTLPGTVERLEQEQLIRSVTRNRGEYAFLIGAGTSLSGGIPTASGLIEQWKKKSYLHHRHGLQVDCWDDDDERHTEVDLFKKAVQEWVDDRRTEKMKPHQNEYGFWFSECYPTREERRRVIHRQVADASVQFGHIMLAALLNADPPYVSHILTPNFDDLMYDAFYRYFDERPHLLAHNQIIGQEFQVTEKDPVIIKLHGDFLYSNLQNTAAETATLEENMRRALERVLEEYGLVVVGYGGMDTSIMNVLADETFETPEPGLFWCTRDSKDLPKQVERVLQKPNTYVVEIDGFQQLMSEFYRRIRYRGEPLFPNIEQIEDRTEKLANDIVHQVGSSEQKAETEDLIQSLRNRLAADFWHKKNRPVGGEDEYAEWLYKLAIIEDPGDPRNYYALAEYYADSDAKDPENRERLEKSALLYTFAIKGLSREQARVERPHIRELWESVGRECGDPSLFEAVDKQLFQHVEGAFKFGPDWDGKRETEDAQPRSGSICEFFREIIGLQLGNEGNTDRKDAIDPEDIEQLDIEGVNRPEYYNGRGRVWRKLALMTTLELAESDGESTAAGQQFNKASRYLRLAFLDFELALQLDPESYLTLVQEGITAFRKARLYEQVERLHQPDTAEVRELDEPEAVFQRAANYHTAAIEQTSDGPLAYLNRAEVWLRLERFDEAGRDGEKAAEHATDMDKLVLAKFFELVGKSAEFHRTAGGETEYTDEEIMSLERRFRELTDRISNVDWELDDIEETMAHIHTEDLGLTEGWDTFGEYPQTRYQERLPGWD